MCDRIFLFLAYLLPECAVDQLWEAKPALVWNIFFIFQIKTLFELTSRTQRGVCSLDRRSHRDTTLPQLIVRSWNAFLCSCSFAELASHAARALGEERVNKMEGKKAILKVMRDCFILIHKVETRLHVCCGCFEGASSWSWAPFNGTSSETVVSSSPGAQA